MATTVGLLVKVAGDGNQFEVALRSAGAPEVEPILYVPERPQVAAVGLAAAGPSTWLRVRGGACTWDDAHQFLASGKGFAAGPGVVQAIEPDFEQGWTWRERPTGVAVGIAGAGAAEFCAFDPQDGSGGKAMGPSVAWNANDEFSGFAKARQAVGDKLEKSL
jgi:hypothetical protein